MRSAARMLKLEAHARAHRGDSQGVTAALRALIAASHALEAEPLMVSQLVRLAVGGIATGTLEDMLGQVDFTDEQLAQLQADVRQLDLQPGLRRSLLGERVIGSESIRDLAPTGLPTSNEGRALYLKTTRGWIAASEQPFPQAFQQAQLIEQQFREEVGTSPLSRMRSQLTMTVLPTFQVMFQATARGLASSSMADTAIAIEQFRRRHGRPPQSLDELVPEFLPAVPIDPFDGQPLRYATDPGGFRIYSIGGNAKDDGGVEGNEMLDDVFSVVFRPGPQPTEAQGDTRRHAR